MPDDVVFVAEIPHTAAGKIKKTALREQFADYRCRRTSDWGDRPAGFSRVARALGKRVAGEDGGISGTADDAGRGLDAPDRRVRANAVDHGRFRASLRAARNAGVLLGSGRCGRHCLCRLGLGGHRFRALLEQRGPWRRRSWRRRGARSARSVAVSCRRLPRADASGACRCFDRCGRSARPDTRGSRARRRDEPGRADLVRRCCFPDESLSDRHRPPLRSAVRPGARNRRSRC